MCVFDRDRLRGDVDFKIDFLNKLKENDYEKRTIEDAYRRFTNHISFFEETMFGKDLYDFTLEELKILLKGMNRTDLLTLQGDLTMIKKYCFDALNEGKGIHSVSPSTGLKRKDLKECVNQVAEEGKLITKSEFYDNLVYVQNFKDKAMLILMWKGFSGDYRLNPLVQLKEKDIDIDNKRILIGKDIYDSDKNIIDVEKVLINLTDEETYIFKIALKEEFFWSYNKKEEVEFVKNDYFFKPRANHRLKDGEDAPISVQILKTRMQIIKAFLSENSPLKNQGQQYWTPSTLQRSGAILKLMEQKGKWTDNELRKHVIASEDLKYNPTSFIRAFRILEEKYKKEKFGTSEEVATTK